MADLKIDFSNCDVNIEKMFDIHDNQNVNVYNNVPKNKANNKSSKSKEKLIKKPGGKPMTLKYYKHGDNGILMKQRERVTMIFRMFNAWKWIDETNSDDFDAFFEGKPKHCNIIWKSNSTILTILLQELLKQSYIERQTGCSAKSLVTEQFGKTPLDINNPLAEEYEGKTKMDVDQQFADLCVIYEDKLRSTKGI